jgi:sugar/nucleoside kinase (ribokinase family)
MNLPELNELAKRNLTSDQEIREFGGYILSLGPRAVLITLREHGAVMFFDNNVRRFEGWKVRRFKDATGCGDVFSAGFLVSYLVTKDLTKSVDFANRVAAAKCRVSGTEGMKNLLKRVVVPI